MLQLGILALVRWDYQDCDWIDTRYSTSLRLLDVRESREFQAAFFGISLTRHQGLNHYSTGASLQALPNYNTAGTGPAHVKLASNSTSPTLHAMD